MRRFNTIIESANPPGINQLWIDKKKLRYFAEGKWQLLTGGGGGSSEPPEISDHDTWIIDGTDTGKPSRGKEGDNGLTPLLRVTDTAVEYSYDNVTWFELIPKSDFVINNNNEYINNPDEEDITSVADKLKFKDKSYSPTTFSGLGRTYLRKNVSGSKNILTQSMINTPNTIYHIQYDYDLNGQTITIPANCTLEFDGGSLNNGTIVGTDTIIQSNKYHIFKGLTIQGSFIGSAHVEWWGARGYPTMDNSVSYHAEITEACNSVFNEIVFGSLVYYVSSTINCNISKKISFGGTMNPGLQADRGEDILKYVSGGIIATDKNIDLLFIKLDKQYTNAVYAHHQMFSIDGGTFDVSKATDYTKAVITIDCADGINTYPDFRNINIVGPGKKLTPIANFNTGVGIKLSNIDSTGTIYGGYINAYISLLGKAFHNTCPLSPLNGLSYISNITFDCYIDYCPVAYDFGTNTYGSNVYGWIQAGRFYDAKENEGCLITGNTLDIAFFMKAWDTNAYSDSIGMATTRYVFDNRTSTLSAPLLFGTNNALNHTAFKGPIWNVKNVQNRNDRRYNDLWSMEFANYVSNTFIAATNITYELTGCTVNNNSVPNNIFLDGVTVSKVAGATDIQMKVSFVPVGNVKRFAAVLAGCWGENVSTFKTINIKCYNNSTVILDKTFSNLAYDGAYYDYAGYLAYEITASDLNESTQFNTDKIEITFSDATTNFSSSVLSIQGGGNNNFSHINTPYNTTIYKNGVFRLGDYRLSIDSGRRMELNIFGITDAGYMPSISIATSSVSDLLTKAQGSYLTRGSICYISTVKGVMPLVYNNTGFIDFEGHPINSAQFIYSYGAWDSRPNTSTVDNIYMGFKYHNSDDKKQYFYENGNWYLSDGVLKDTRTQGTTAQRPTTLTADNAGFIYMDTTLKRPVWWDGTQWVDWFTASSNATLTFTGAVSATYNGSEPVTVNIPTGGSGTTDYNDLTNKPKIGTVELTGTKTLADLGIQPEGDYATNAEVTSAINTALTGYATQTYVNTQIQAAIGVINTTLDEINGEVI